MFYKQTVNNIKVVIIPLDGGLLDLNRLRFNYFKRICKKHNYNITKKEFEDSLGNMKTMYQQFPISKNYSSEEINNVIERDLFEYAKLKPDAIKKEGTEELLHFFNQRKIKVAVLSTHKIKSAIRYLQLTKLYNQIDFIIGGSEPQFLEVNPEGQFGWLDDENGLPLHNEVADAILDPDSVVTL